MNIVNRSLAMLAALSCCTSAFAAKAVDVDRGDVAKPARHSAADQTLLVTLGTQVGGKNIAAVDFQSDGTAMAIQFAVVLPKGVRGVDTSSCVADLPSNFSGRCSVSKNMSNVAFAIYTTGTDPLPAGMLSIGSFSFDSKAKVAGSELTVGGLEVVSVDGRALSSKSKVVALD